MKRIIVPTDFSRNAYNAMDYAVAIANVFGAAIELVSIYQTSSRAGMLMSLEERIKQDAEASMDRMERSFNDKLKNGAHIKIRVLKGDTIATLARFAEQLEADLIVMGTQGASGVQEVFLGSTTSGLIKQTDIPLLAIPADADFDDLDKIVFAVDDLDVSSQKIVQPLTQIARKFDASVLVYHQEKDETDRGIDPSIDIFMDNVEHSFHYELDSDNVNESIKDFVEDYDADMLCMIQRKRGFWQNLFHSSVTTREVFHSKVPLLILTHGMFNTSKIKCVGLHGNTQGKNSDSHVQEFSKSEEKALLGQPLLVSGLFR